MQRKPTGTPRTKKNDDVVFDSPKTKTPSDILSNIKLDIKHKNETQKAFTQSIKNNDITICTGKPGTGKTFLSCFEALSELKSKPHIKKIVLVKSVMTLKSEEIGFLKGTMEEKMEPFMYSFMKNFEKIIGKEKIELLKVNDMIEIIPIAYMRGINIDNAIVIIDEAQNISIDNIRTILTRLGENSKMVFLGDINQIDSKNKNDSALKFLLTNFSGIEGIGVIEFGVNDIIRHPLIKKIEQIFDNIKQDKIAFDLPKPVKPEPIEYKTKFEKDFKPSLIQRFFNLFS